MNPTKLGRCGCHNVECDHYGHWYGNVEKNSGRCFEDAVRMVTVYLPQERYYGLAPSGKRAFCAVCADFHEKEGAK